MPEKIVDLSVITVVFNAAERLERTILSVLNQTSRNFEYLIIDGNSTDGTLELIEKYKDKIDIVVSEPDRGLYDAMNKALKTAHGKFVWFINAGDEIADPQVIELLSPYLNQADIIYSDTMVIDPNGKEIGLLSRLTHNKAPDNLNWKKMRFGMMVCHQSFIVKKEIAPLFDEKYRISGDIDWVIKCLKKARNVRKTPFLLSRFMQAGLSKKYLKKAMKERYHILRHHFGFLPNLFAHIYLFTRYLFRGRYSKVG